MNMESLHGLMEDFTKEILLEDKEKEKENLNWQTGGYERRVKNLKEVWIFH